MKTWIGVLIGVAIGGVAGYVSNKSANRKINVDKFHNGSIYTTNDDPSQNSKDKSEANVSEDISFIEQSEDTISETQNPNVGEESLIIKESKDLTLTETISKYTNEGNMEMVSKINELTQYLKENNIYTDPTVGEVEVPKTIDDLCKHVTSINNKIKQRYDEELDYAKKSILSKSTRKYSKVIYLPESIQSSSNFSNVAFTRVIRLTHVNEARSRINRLTRRFTIQTMKVLENDWFQILYNVVEMHRDLNKLDILIPRVTNIYPSVNVIADTEFNNDNRKAYLRHLENTLSEDEYLFCTKYDKELEYSQWK